MQIETYSKHELLRSEFGRQCIFSDADITLCEIDPDDELTQKFGRKKTANVYIQSAPRMAEDEVTTDDSSKTNYGLYHFEGGWPNGIDASNEGEKWNHLKKYAGSEQYKMQLKSMCLRMEHKIAQNNTCNLFEEYFAG